MINKPTIKWGVKTRGIYDQDTGATWIQVNHTLTMDILATDMITFDLNFDNEATGKSIVEPNVITYDSSRCIIKQNTRDTDYWEMTPFDGYWFKSSDSPPKYTYTQDYVTSQDWKCRIIDDATLDTDKFCQKPPAVTPPTPASPYACKSLKCVVERPLITNDNLYDAQFSTTTGTPEFMVIKPGRALLYF